MLPDPLHPAIVHLPMALAVLLPLASLVAALALARGWLPTRAWAFVVALNLLLVGSSWAALETGEAEEERAERVVPESAIESHEERAEAFLWIAVAALAISGAGLLSGRGGQIGRAAAVAASLAVLAGGIRVGHSGGELVYVHGAASAYARADAPTGGVSAGTAQEARGAEEDDDEE